MTLEQVALIEKLSREPHTLILELPGTDPAVQTYGTIMLSNGMEMAGNWTFYMHANLANFTDDKGVQWWIDVSQVIGYSPQPVTPAQVPAE